MISETKHKQLEESLYRRKRAFSVLYIIFIFAVICAASVGAAVCSETAELVKKEDNTLANDSLACFALSSALCFAFFVVFATFLYKVFFFVTPKNNDDSIKYSFTLWIVVIACCVIMVVAVITQSFGNEDLYSCIREELGQNPITENTTGMICLATTWFVAFSAALLIAMLVLIVNIRTTLVNTLIEHLKEQAQYNNI